MSEGGRPFGRSPQPSSPPVKLSELVATLSLLSDLGMGRPVERVLRQTVIAMRLAELADIDKGVQAATYYASLLTWVGCGADTSDLAELFGDEMGLFADTHEGDLHGMTLAMFMVRHLGRGSSPVRRLSMTSRFVATAGRSVQQVMMSHCQSTGALAERLGLGDDVSQPWSRPSSVGTDVVCRGLPGPTSSPYLLASCSWQTTSRPFTFREAPRRPSTWLAESAGPISTPSSSTSSAGTARKCWMGSTRSRPGTR